MMDSAALPPGISVFERGWLSSNNVLIRGREQSALVDSGYATHADQTLSLVTRALGGEPLDLLVNTHLHSDHCGGNAALQRAFPFLRTLIPPGQADAVARWDAMALTYEPTGQKCERFHFEGVLRPNSEVRLGDSVWQVHSAPGHDPHSIVLFQPNANVLISADALWENGFGIVFPELEGVAAFDEVAATLDLVERLRPRVVIPGHGRVFGESALPDALARARSRLDAFVQDPARHARHAAKVLLKFKLLELQRLPYKELERWALGTAYFNTLFARYFVHQEAAPWLESIARELVRAGAATMDAGQIANA